jgi:hypothetical protein
MEIMNALANKTSKHFYLANINFGSQLLKETFRTKFMTIGSNLSAGGKIKC